MSNSIKSQFLLDPTITHLNHGSFGACPKPVFEDYQKWQLELERSPVEFMMSTGRAQVEISKQALADYVNCKKEDLIYVPNPTTAMNIVIKSLFLNEGDEVLSTNQEYGAIERTWKFYCKRAGAKFIQQDIKLPLTTKEAFLEQFWAGLTAKTKIVFLSQITSQTALIFPVAEICARAKELGLITIVDGAHVAGHIPLNITTLKADIYTGACHKWLCTPKGNSFLYVTKELQSDIDPLVISWGYNPGDQTESQFQDYLQYNGTRDFSAYLTTPAAMRFLEENNWEEHKLGCRKLLAHYYPIVAQELNSAPICPVSKEFLGQICSIPIRTSDFGKLKDLLFNKYRIEIPIMAVSIGTFLRITFQAYNTEKEIEHLIHAIRDIKSNTQLIE